jgi:hypothetical protein
LIDVGHVTDNCAPLTYKHAIVKRAGQVACAKIDLRPGHSGYTLITKSGHALPNQGVAHVHYFSRYTNAHIEDLVARGRKAYEAAYAAANRSYIVRYHDWYWSRLDWEIRLVLNAVKLGKNLSWPQGYPLAEIEGWMKTAMVWNQEWFDGAVKAMKNECATEPVECPKPLVADSMTESFGEEDEEQPLGGIC